MNNYQESCERGERQKENERWVTHCPFSSERLITTEKMAKMMVTEKKMMMKGMKMTEENKMMMTEKMAKMMSRGVTHGPARCSLGPHCTTHQIGIWRQCRPAGCSRENIG